MKFIKYKICVAHIDGEDILLDKEINCKTQEIFDLNYPLAENEAVGDIVIEGEFEIEQPTQLDTVEAQITYTAMMTGTLLEEV